MMGIAALVIYAAAPVAAALEHPLSKADKGFIQCYEPDEKSKTCASIAFYKRNQDGTWSNTAIVLLSPNRAVTLETVTPVSVKGGAVCGFIRRSDIMTGKLRISGETVPAEKATYALTKIADGMAPMMDKEICTHYVEAGETLLAKGTMGGASMAIPDQRVKWVLPSDGYSVAPASAAKP
jgi:hypothetical protein